MNIWDDEVLKQGVPRGNYQALLVNQALGGPVFTISHQFNQSLILKRIIMMTKMKSPQLAKAKALLFIPLTACLLMAFSNPEPLVKPVVEKVESLKQQITDGNLLPGMASQNTSSQEKGSITIKGKVIDGSTSKPLEGVNVIIKGTTKGTISDAKGEFKIKADGAKITLVFSYIGYTTMVIDYDENDARVTNEIKMIKAAINIELTTVTINGEKPSFEIKPDPYVIIDGIPSEGSAYKDLDPNTIESVSVLKGENATKLYGDKGKNGVILITTKKGNTTGSKSPEIKNSDKSAVFTVVEDMPSFPGGQAELTKFLSNNLKMPAEGAKTDVEGTVYASFNVNEDGSISGAKILKGLGQSYDEEVLRVISLMPKWIPGKQNGKTVATLMNIPVKFSK